MNHSHQKWWKRGILNFLKVPPEPAAPPGSFESVRVFRAAENFLKYNIFQWVLRQFGAIIGIVVTITFLRNIGGDGWLGTLFLIGEILAIIGFLFTVVFTFILTILDYDQRWYIITDKALRIREGVRDVKELTLTFANIQNLSIRQGPVQRFLNISDLQVVTAGGGSVGGADGGDLGGSHVAYFRGVGNAEEIREIIQMRLRRFKNSGLGDPDDDQQDEEENQQFASVNLASAIAAARDLVAETKALRQTISDFSDDEKVL